MSQQHLHLLGSVQVSWEKGSPPRFRSQRTAALLGYLAAESRPFSRDYLAALLWPDEDPGKGKANLRRELHNLARILPGCWQTSRVEVQFVPGEGTAVDIYELRQYEAAGQWQDAADLIGGNFLEGIVLAENLEFETWLLGEQERWRQRAVLILQRSADAFERKGMYQRALNYARRLLQLMPWREETHCQVMQLLALSGRRSEALKQFEICRQVLQTELGVAVSAETHALQQRIKLNANFTLHNLPGATTPFIGRQRELDELAGWLSGPTVRLITITGPGGMGKTRLALASASQFIDSKRLQPQPPFSDGIYFVNLAPLTEWEQITSSMAIALGFKLQPDGNRSLSRQLLDYLQPKRMLLILDNFEHLLSGATIVSDILTAAPGVQILVTSRERLNINGEQLLPLDGLRYKSTHHVENVDGPVENEAARLFLRTAQRNNPTLKPTLAGNNHIARICHLVEGMPLALELAARWVDSMPLPDIATELEQNLPFLETEAPDLPTRHRSMQAVFESSWKQLSNEEQMILSSLSVFRGGFTYNAAKDVTGASRKTLSMLVSRSFLRFEQPVGRYHFHELLRQYTAGHLQEYPERAKALRHNHLAYFCQLAAEGEQELRGGDQVGWINRLLKERNNVNSAIDWGLEHNFISAARLAAHLYFFWFVAGLSEEGERQYLKLLPRQGDLPDNLRAWLLTGYVSVIWLKGKFEEIEKRTHEAIPLFETTNDRTGLALSYHHLSLLKGFMGEAESALKTVDLAIQYAREEKEGTWPLSLCLTTKADFLLKMEAVDLAREILNENYRLCSQRKDKVIASDVQQTLARIDFLEGNLQESKKICGTVLAITQDLNDSRIETFAYTLLGQIALAEGNSSEAIDHLNVAAKIGDENNQWDALIGTYITLGDAHLALTEYGYAADYYHQSTALCQEMETPEYMAICLEKLARLHWQQESRGLEPVQWLATATSWREEAHLSPSPPDREALDRLLLEMKERLSEQDFSRSWQHGAAQSLAETLATAVKIPPISSP